MKYICVILMALAFVACDKNAESDIDSALDSANLNNAKNFDFGALKAEAEAQEIDLSKIILADSAKSVDSALDSAKSVDSANSAQHTKPSNALASTPQITKTMAKFYLLEGEIEGQSATLYLKIASARDEASENQGNALAYITGKIVRGAEIYTLEGEVENEKKALALEISNDDKRQVFEAQIAPNGEVSGKFIGEEIFKNEAIFKRAQGKINEITIFGVSVAQKHKGKDFDGKDRDFDYNVSMQIPRIGVDGKMSVALDKINGALREMAMPDLIDDEDFTNFNSVSTFDVDYIDEKIIVLDNYKYFYSGGAHGIYSDEAISFDLKSGEIIANDAESLLKDKNDPALLKMVRERLKAEYEDSVDENAELSRFRIRPNGVEFFWGVYEIAPYAVGIVRINFSFDELAEFIKADSIYAYLFKAQN